MHQNWNKFLSFSWSFLQYTPYLYLITHLLYCHTKPELPWCTYIPHTHSFTHTRARKRSPRSVRMKRLNISPWSPRQTSPLKESFTPQWKFGLLLFYWRRTTIKYSQNKSGSSQSWFCNLELKYKHLCWILCATLYSSNKISFWATEEKLNLQNQCFCVKMGTWEVNFI